MVKQLIRPRRDRDPNGAVGADISKSLATRAAAAQGPDLPWRLLSSVEHVHIHTVPTIRFNDGLALT
jgi:hypothetical protein